MYFFHWDELVRALKGATKLDIHARLMKPYKKVPIWWWVAIIAIVMGMSIAMTEVFHTGLPVYGIFLAFIIPAIYMVPCGMIQGVTNVSGLASQKKKIKIKISAMVATLMTDLRACIG